MAQNRTLFIGLAALALLAASGCSTVGEKRFACPGRPAGVHCMSATEVYTATENTDAVAPTAKHALGNDPSAVPKRSRAVSQARHGQQETPHTPVDQPGSALSPGHIPQDPRLTLAGTVLPAVDKPVPIRTPAQ